MHTNPSSHTEHGVKYVMYGNANDLVGMYMFMCARVLCINGHADVRMHGNVGMSGFTDVRMLHISRHVKEHRATMQAHMLNSSAPVCTVPVHLKL